MKKLSEYQNEEALDILADLIEPAAKIFSDKAIEREWNSGNRIGAVKVAIKNHKSEVIDILAIMEGIPRDEYKCNVVTIPARLLEILNDPDLVDFFGQQSQSGTDVFSGSAMASTEDDAQ